MISASSRYSRIPRYSRIQNIKSATPALAVNVLERRVVNTLRSVTALLVLAGGLSVIARLYLPDFFGRDLFIGLFHLNGESNIPAAYSALILLLAALLLGVIAWARRRSGQADAASWKALTLIFGFLALDEAAMLHERTADITRSLIQTDGILHYAWVVPYGVLALLVGLAFLRFLRQLPPRIRNRVILAGGLYVMGALGFELLEGLVVSAADGPSVLNEGLIVVEEGLEMLGVVLFIGALLSYVRSELPGLRLSLNVAPGPSQGTSGTD